MIILLIIISFLIGLYFPISKLIGEFTRGGAESLLKKRLRRFQSIKRGYYSFILIIFLYVLSWFNFLIIHDKPVIMYHNGTYYSPAWQDPPAIGPYHSEDWKDPYTWETFGQSDKGKSEPDYKELKEIFKNDNEGNWIIMPAYPYSPSEDLLGRVDGTPPTAPTYQNIFGTDANGGRDVFSRMAYAFNYTLSFALIVTAFSYVIGITIGALLGYFGGRFDIFGQRFIEIFSTMPYLYTIIIIRESFDSPPGLIGLAFILVVFSWMGMTYYIRGEFYREKSKDYVSAAISLGADTKRVITKHILPNALTPIITFAPFAIMANIAALTSLDFLGFGLVPPAPSWGEMARQGISEFRWWLILAPMLSSFFTLILITFIGESIREAFDPRGHSRLR